MFSLPHILSRLYPDKPENELQGYLDICERDARDLFHRQWKTIQKEDLGDIKVQLDLIRTLFDTQFSYVGDLEEIMRSLEDWSEGQLAFEFLDPASNVFYQRLYCYLGFIHFAYLERGRQLFLLSSRFLVLAAVWEIPLYINVQAYFRRYIFKDEVQVDEDMFARAIEFNETPIGTEGKSLYTIREWVEFMMTTQIEDLSNLVDYFIQTDMRVQRLDPADKKILQRILMVFFSLKTGTMWREIEDGGEVVGLEHKEPVHNKTADEYYLELLSQATSSQFDTWMKDWPDVLLWILSKPKENREDFLNRLFYVVTQKVDLNDEEQVEGVIDMIESLHMPVLGLQLGEDVIFFNEEDGQFHWDEKVLEALRDYAATPRPQEPPKVQSVDAPVARPEFLKAPAI